MNLHLIFRSLRSSLSAIWKSFFLAPVETKNSFLHILWLIILYVFGVYLWGKLFSWGHIPLDFSDWALINIPRLDFVRDALKMGVLPLHMSDTAPLHYISDRFL